MASHLESKLKKLSVVALNQETSLPIARMPFYAEVGVRSTLQPPPVALDNRFNDLSITHNFAISPVPLSRLSSGDAAARGW